HPGALVFAEADEHHLHEAALELALEPGVGFDAVDDEDVIGPGSIAREVNGDALRRTVQNDGFHVAPDRAAAETLGDAVIGENAPLSLGRAAAVAAHGRHDERLRAEVLEMVHRRLNDEMDASDAAAAGGDGDALSGPDTRAEVEPLQFAMDFG